MAWNRPTEVVNKEPKRKSPAGTHILIAALVAVLAIGAGVFFLMPEDKVEGRSVPVAKKRAKVKVQPVSSHRISFDTKGETNPKVRQAMEVLNKKADAIEIKRLQLAAKFAKLPKPAKSIFKSGGEQLLSWICETEPGDMPMPMPRLEGEDLQNVALMLVEKNEPLETDSEEIAAVKENLKAAKEEMRKFIKAGGDPNDFLQYHNDQLIRCFEFRNEALQQVAELYEEDKSLARDFLKKLNERFDSEGIKLISEDEAGFEESGSEGQALTIQ